MHVHATVLQALLEIEDVARAFAHFFYQQSIGLLPASATQTMIACSHHVALSSSDDDRPLHLVSGKLSAARQGGMGKERNNGDRPVATMVGAHVPCPVFTAANISKASSEWETPAIVRGLPPWPESLEWLNNFEFGGRESGDDCSSDTDASIEAQRAFIKLFAAVYGPHPSFLPATGNLRLSCGCGLLDCPTDGITRGAGFNRHAFSWLRLLRGHKTWFFAPPHVAYVPADTHYEYCLGQEPTPPEGVTFVCEQARQA